MEHVETTQTPQGQASTLDAEPKDATDLAVQKVKQWLLSRSLSEKLTFTILWNLTFADHGTADLANEIIDQYESDIMAATEKKTLNAKLNSDEHLMVGVALELLVWRSHYSN